MYIGEDKDLKLEDNTVKMDDSEHVAAEFRGFGFGNMLRTHPEALEALLADRTRTEYETRLAATEGRAPEKRQWNIVWGTDDYLAEHGEGFGKGDEIEAWKVTGKNAGVVVPRTMKSAGVRRRRAKDRAEVFTPCWVCNAQNNLVDEAWFGRPGVFNVERDGGDGSHGWIPTEGRIPFAEETSPASTRSWADYVGDVRLEITCGEAPYLASRHDPVTGEPISDTGRRIGILDRKLRVVTENARTVEEWLEWAGEALKATYGFEWQGDSLLLARMSMLGTVDDHLRAAFGRGLDDAHAVRFANIVSWNLWQMDGLRMVLPYSCTRPGDDGKTGCPACARGAMTGHDGIRCVIRDWKAGTGDGPEGEEEEKEEEGREVVFESLLEGLDDHASPVPKVACGRKGGRAGGKKTDIIIPNSL